MPCATGGETLLMPNGDEMLAPKQGLNVGEGSRAVETERPGATVDGRRSVFRTDFGTFGLIIGQLNPHTYMTTGWGTQDGLARYRAAFGKQIQNDKDGRVPGCPPRGELTVARLRSRGDRPRLVLGQRSRHGHTAAEYLTHEVAGDLLWVEADNVQ